MINRCVNPDCGTELKVFNIGTLYALERRSVNTEFFWLCPACEPTVALCLDSKGSVVVKSRSGNEHHQPPHPENRLRLISRVAERRPWLEASRARGFTLPGRAPEKAAFVVV